jgi:hypothetical protein
MNLEGNIREFPLSDLLTLVSDSAVTGLIEIGERERAGRIFCSDGRVYHAEAGALAGVDAIRQMLDLQDAPFRFIAGVRHAAETLWPDSQMLIGFIRRQEQFYRRVRQYIPSLAWIPVLCISSGGASIRLNAAIWPILATMDGQRSVVEIARLLGQEPIEIGLAISDLIGRGLCNIKPPYAASAEAARPAEPVASDAEAVLDAQAPTEEDAGGFFEWLLTGKSAERPAAWFSRSLMVLNSLLLS